MLYIRDLIRKKEKKEELTEEEINFFIDSYNKDEILKEQAAALLTLIHTNGLSEKEMAFMAQAIADSGEKTELYELSNKIIDIHPIGGLDDKIVIILLAIMSELKIPAVKAIGREIGIKDKLPSNKVDQFDNKQKMELKERINNNEIILLKEPENLAPVENKLYKLRNDIACNSDISIIAINLISQEIALGFKNVLFDISYGETAYVKTLSDAEKLAKYLTKIGNTLNINVKCIITKLDEPIGNFFGNTLELYEILENLNVNMHSDIQELILEFGSSIMEFEANCNNEKQNKQQILEIIKTKKAYQKLISLIGNNKITKMPKQKIPVMATVPGYISSINVSLIRTTAQYLNAIRHNEDSYINENSGIEFCKKIGDKVDVGDLLGYIYTDDETKIQKAVSNFKLSFNIIDKKIKKKSRIVEKL